MDKELTKDMDDITKELKPSHVLGLYVAGALSGGWRMWAVRWAWRLDGSKAILIANCLEDFGITDEMISNTNEFKKLIGDNRYG